MFDGLESLIYLSIIFGYSFSSQNPDNMVRKKVNISRNNWKLVVKIFKLLCLKYLSIYLLILSRSISDHHLRCGVGG